MARCDHYFNLAIELDAADSAGILIKSAGTQYTSISDSSSDLVISSTVSDKDMLFKGNDGGSTQRIRNHLQDK